MLKKNVIYYIKIYLTVFGYKNTSYDLNLIKEEHRRIASERVTNEHAIGFLKRFKILSEGYRNRRKRFGLRFNLIAGICNFELDMTA